MGVGNSKCCEKQSNLCSNSRCLVFDSELVKQRFINIGNLLMELVYTTVKEYHDLRPRKIAYAIRRSVFLKFSSF